MINKPSLRPDHPTTYGLSVAGLLLIGAGFELGQLESYLDTYVQGTLGPNWTIRLDLDRWSWIGRRR